MTTIVQASLPGVTDRYPGMMDRRNWRRTRVHQHSRYSCAWCGRKFADPHSVYDHLDRRHPERMPKQTREILDPATDGREGASTYPPPSVSSEAFAGDLPPVERRDNGSPSPLKIGVSRGLRRAAWRSDDTCGEVRRKAARQ